MKIITTVQELKDYIRKQKSKDNSIGLVPTMGFLHQGHLSLISRAVAENDIVIVSIFVNPTQFGPNEDYDNYPRDLERDQTLVEEAGASIIFAPNPAEMYPTGHKTYVEVMDITEILCGASRPNHFSGVTTIVNKLFQVVQPDRAYFGQKDAQQLIVIKQMVRDMFMDVKVIGCPIIREKDGLAMSSRNVYLSVDERKQAPVLYRSLQLAQKQIKAGERDAKKIREMLISKINEQPLANIDYVSIVDLNTLQEIGEVNGDVLIALAVKFGKTRLIDNIILEG